MIITQLIVTCFAAFVVLRLVQSYRRRTMTGAVFIVWLALWLAVVAVFWMPEIASRLATIFGIGRGADLIVYLAVVVLFYLVYRIFQRLEKLDHDISTLTRHIALHDAHKSSDNGRGPDTEL